jgi:hypothetical protein
MLKGGAIGVAGGDVLRIAEGRLLYTDANWYCNRMKGESSMDYANRSVEQALRFVSSFAPEAEYEPLFVIVFAASQ